MSIASTVRLPREQRQGFTLLELLLALFLLSLLFGAVIFSFSSLKSGAELNEGIDRFESLLRFARAHAAYSGCRVQLQFQPDPSLPFGPNLYSLRLAWESEPSDNPGAYRPLPATAWNIEGINELVAAAPVIEPDTSDILRQAQPAETEVASTSQMTAGEGFQEPVASALPPVTFFPDGTSDSARILLVSRAEDDPRRVLLRLTGITGSFSHEWITQPEAELFAEEDEWLFDLDETMLEFDEDWASDVTEPNEDWLSESTDATAELDYDWISDVLDELEQADDLDLFPAPTEEEEANGLPRKR